MKPFLSNFLWLVAGTVVFSVLVVLGLRSQLGPSGLQVNKTRELELTTALRSSLAAQSEAEKSAVLASSDESQRYAGEARARGRQLDAERAALRRLIDQDGTDREKQLLGELDKSLAELQRIDAQLLELAVQNTNLKATALAFGPAAEAARQMDLALSKLVDSDSKKVVAAAARAQASLLRLQVMLPPHIAEESDAKMDAMETAMSKEDQTLRQSLKELPPSPELEAGYTRFSELRQQILALSRQNTNVRSLSISLTQKRKVMLVCQELLATLEQALGEEALPGVLPRPR